MPDPREVVAKATEEIRNTTIELYREWHGADAEVTRLRDELDGVRARARAYIESMQEGPAEAEIIGDVLWDNPTLIERHKARVGGKPSPDHVWSTEYDSATHRAIGGCWVPTPSIAAVGYTRAPALRWEIRLDGEVRESFEDATSAWQRWDSDLYDRDEHMLYGPDDKLLAHGTLDSRLMREGRPRFTSEMKPRHRHITDGRDRSGIEWTKCGLIANDPEDPNDPECSVCRSLDG